MPKQKRKVLFTLELLNARGDNDIAENLERIKAMYPKNTIQVNKTKTKTLYEVLENDKRK